MTTPARELAESSALHSAQNGGVRDVSLIGGRARNGPSRTQAILVYEAGIVRVTTLVVIVLFRTFLHPTPGCGQNPTEERLDVLWPSL
jgi:hypothetical protein